MPGVLRNGKTSGNMSKGSSGLNEGQGDNKGDNNVCIRSCGP